MYNAIIQYSGTLLNELQGIIKNVHCIYYPLMVASVIIPGDFRVVCKRVFCSKSVYNNE